MRFLAFVLSLLVFLWALPFTAHGEPMETGLPEIRRQGERVYVGQGYAERVGPLRVVHLKGSPWEIGLQSALLLREEALTTREMFRAKFDPAAQQHRGWDRLVWAFKDLYMRMKLRPIMVRNIPEEYRQEMRGFVYGMSDGQTSDLDQSVLLANAFQDLMLTYGCSGFAAFGPATADGRLYHGRNLDFSDLEDLAQYAVVAIYEPEEGYPFATLTYPANCGVMHGMNSRGISISMKYSKVTREELSLDGVPFTILLRQVIQYAGTMEEAIDMIRYAPRTIGLNVLIADAKIPDACVVEVGSDRYAVRSSHQGFISATNQFQTQFMKEVQESGWFSSYLRDARFEELREELAGGIDEKVCVDILRDKYRPGSTPYESLLEGIDNRATIASLVFSPSDLRFWVAIPRGGRPAPDTTFYGFDLAKELSGIPYEREALRIPAAEEDAHLADWLDVIRADELLAEGQVEKAQALLMPILERRPKAQVPLYLMGRVALRSKDLQAAERFFSYLVSQPEPADLGVYKEGLFYLGYVHDRFGRRSQAIDYYRKALEVKVPDLGGTHHWVDSYAQRGLEEAF